MVKDPRSPKPGSQEPDDALDLLRALARSHGAGPAPREGAAGGGEAEKLDALRALAAKLDSQLKTPQPAAAEPTQRSAPPRTSSAQDGRTTTKDRWARLAASLWRPRWPGFRAALAPLRSLRLEGHRFGRRQMMIATAGLVVVAGAALGFLFWALRSPVAIPRDDHAATAPAQSVPPTTLEPAFKPPDIPAINKAMSDCDAAAAADRASLYFLVLPLLPANESDQTWRAVALQTIGNSYLLLSAKDALDGLRTNKLMVRPYRYTFSVLDTESGQTYSWTSATSMSRLAKRDSGAVKTLKLGFDFSEQQTGAQWSAEFKREPGTCYWVSALIRR